VPRAAKRPTKSVALNQTGRELFRNIWSGVKYSKNIRASRKKNTKPSSQFYGNTEAIIGLDCDI